MNDTTSHSPGRIALLILVTFAGLLAITASGGGGGESPATGTNPSVAAKTSAIPPGDADCPNGGILVETGIDENSNGVLDANEVDASEKVCNGAQGDAGLDALVKISDEPAGGNCPAGGKRIDSGLDANANGVLDDAEIASTDYLCNGLAGNDGREALVAMNPEPAGVNCPNGGLRIDSGIDVNGNGSLDPGEITQTGFVCEGEGGGIGWQVPTRINDRGANVILFPALAMANGRAMAVWERSNGSTQDIKANYYVEGYGWRTLARFVDTDDTHSAGLPDVALNDSGAALLVWPQSDGARINVWVRPFDVPSEQWGAVKGLADGTTTGNTDNPRVAMDANGNAIVVWQQIEGARTDIWASRYLSGVGWISAEQVEEDDTGSAQQPLVAMDANGNALVVWRQYDGSRWEVRARRHVAGSGWQAMQSIGPRDLDSMSYIDLAMDPNGNAVVVWVQLDGISTSIWANRYDADADAWAGAENIGTADPRNPQYPQAAMDASGNAMVVWQRHGVEVSGPITVYQFDIWANRYDAASGQWGGPERIEFDNAGGAIHPQVAMDAAGNALVIWRQYDGLRHNLWSNRHVPGLGWGQPQLVENADEGNVGYQRLAMDSDGNAMALWQMEEVATNSYFSLMANRWRAP